MKIYNTLTRRKEDFLPLSEDAVKIYFCGPTVYNYMHVGNARVNVIFDVIRRYFEYKGQKVRLVQNFTDVDDKIIQRAQAEGITPKALAEKYIQAALADTDALRVARATHYPRVTEEMPEIIQMIQTLIDKGYAYVNKGSVFFDTAKMDDYGKLSRKNVEELEAGARVEINDDKRSPMDFVLWKPAKPGEPAWESPWSAGRPGWHIECSAMAKKYLGTTLDIHGGGADIIFPHHENEIAQSEAANGSPLAQCWMHVGMITVGHRKMSKSLGNFTIAREAAAKVSGETLRFFLLNGHYRMPMEFSDELLMAAQTGLERIKNCYEALRYIAARTSSDTLIDTEATKLAEAAQYVDAFETAMEDDFNTADAVSAVYELVRFINTHTNVNQPDAVTQPFIKELTAKLALLADLLGISPERPPHTLEAEIEAMIAKRQEARARKDWASADQIRNDLLQQGIVLEDTAQGVRWSYKN